MTSDEKIRQLNQAIIAAQSRMHDIGGTDAENDHVRALVEERDALLAEQRNAARLARRTARRTAR
jgi:hypothetical protein